MAINLEEYRAACERGKYYMRGYAAARDMLAGKRESGVCEMHARNMKRLKRAYNRSLASHARLELMLAKMARELAEERAKTAKERREMVQLRAELERLGARPGGQIDKAAKAGGSGPDLFDRLAAHPETMLAPAGAEAGICPQAEKNDRGGTNLPCREAAMPEGGQRSGI